MLVADSGNSRVTLWTSTGGVWSQTGSFGSQGAGSGQFNGPYCVAVAPNGSVFVGDNNNRVAIWEESGGAWSQTDQFGASGSGTGQFSQPRGIAVVSNTRVLVVDSQNDRVTIWEKSGGTWSQTSSFGDTGAVLMDFPLTIAWEPTNSLAFIGNSEDVTVWSLGGGVWSYVETIGTFGLGCAAGQINGPGGLLASTPGGLLTLWVADASLNRLVRWEKQSGTWTEAARTAFDAVNTPEGLAEISGTVYTTSYYDHLVAAVGDICGCAGCRGGGSCKAGTSDAFCGSNGEICVACATGEYCADGACASCTAWNQIDQIQNGSGNAALKNPYAIAAWNGQYLIADWGQDTYRVSVWQQSGSTWSHVENFGTSTLAAAVDLAVASDNRVLVSEGALISEWERTGGTWSKLGDFGSTAYWIRNIAIDSADGVYAPLSDAQSGQLVQVWQKSGGSWSMVESFGGYGSGDDELDEPTGITTTSDGRVWICDKNNGRIAVWQKSGGAWGCVARFGAGILTDPSSIAIDNGAIHIVDSDGGNSRVTIWNEAGGNFSMIGQFSEPKVGCGPTYIQPNSLASIGGELYLANDYGVTIWTGDHCP